MRTKINGIFLNYELVGSGRTLVLTHGLGGSLETWRGIVPKLAEQYRVLTWDVRGFGQSDQPEGEYSPSLFARDLKGLLDKLGIPRIFLLGHSMGGVIAQRFTLDYPGYVEGLILAGTSSEVGPKAAEAWQQRIKTVQEKGMEGVVPWTKNSYAKAFAEAHPEVIEERTRALRANDPRAYCQAVKAISQYNFTHELPNIKCPALILQGEQDRVTPPGGSVIMNRNIPGSRLKIYKEAGHMLPSEIPERFVGDVLEFLGSL